MKRIKYWFFTKKMKFLMFIMLVCRPWTEADGSHKIRLSVREAWELAGLTWDDDDAL